MRLSKPDPISPASSCGWVATPQHQIIHQVRLLPHTDTLGTGIHPPIGNRQDLTPGLHRVWTPGLQGMRGKRGLSPIIVVVVITLSKFSIGFGAQAAELVTAARPAKALAAFTYDLQQESRDLRNMRAEQVCRDFRNYLNQSRSNDLFKRDGTLVRESNQFTSVSWESLDKEKFRQGFMAFAEALNHPNVRSEYLKRYANSAWVLRRFVAHPYERLTEKKSPERWLYRLVLPRPYTRVFTDPTSTIESPTWFPFEAFDWLGDGQGRPNVKEVNQLFGRNSQWLTYAGVSYRVENATTGDGKGAVPKFLKVNVSELYVNGEGQSLMSWKCAVHARNKE